MVKIATVRAYFNTKGYGFLECENGDQFFFHISNYKGKNPITVGTRVQFTLAPACVINKPDQATEIIPIDELPLTAKLTAQAFSMLLEQQAGVNDEF